MNYPIEKYRFIETNNKIIAISTYAGKTVRGVAKCDPRDKFNAEKGRQIAVARCAHKIAKKRMKRADRKYEEALIAAENAKHYLEKMRVYMTEAHAAAMDWSMEVDQIQSRF